MSETIYPTAVHGPADIPLNLPEGFRAITMGGPFMAHNGPIYARWAEDRIQVGFRVMRQHCNPIGTCHGGMMATFADMLLPSVAIYQGQMERRFLPTINLQVDYLGGAPMGAWVQGQGEVLRTTRNMVFLQGLVTADGEPAMRVSGIFKQGALVGHAGDSSDPYGIRGGTPSPR